MAKKGSAISERLEGFFLTRMEACRQFSLERHIVGNIYVTAERILGPWWQISLPMVILFFLSFGYFPSFEESPFELSSTLFAFPAFGFIAADLIPYRSTLLPAGRIEKFHNTLALCFGGTILLTLLLVTLMAASYPLSAVMPDVTWKGHVFSFHAMSLGKFYLCLALPPITMTLGTLFSRKNLSFIISMVIIVAVGTAIIIGRQFMDRLMFLWPGEAPAAIILIAASWIGSSLLLWYHCRRQDLVGQGR